LNGQQHLPDKKRARKGIQTPTIARLIRLANREVARCLQTSFGRFHLAGGAWHYLNTLVEEDGITQRELSQRIDTSEVGTLLQTGKMEVEGLVRRIRDTKDRRVVRIFVTKRGRRTYEKLLPHAAEIISAITAGMSPNEADLLRQLLARATKNIQDYHQTMLACFDDEKPRRRAARPPSARRAAVKA
jgi:MarR family transcriptional regulator, organic hydroperoxide resistance regulator